jgi:hypothetical protein
MAIFTIDHDNIFGIEMIKQCCRLCGNYELSPDRTIPEQTSQNFQSERMKSELWLIDYDS